MLLGILDSNKVLKAKEAEMTIDEIIVSMVLALEQPLGGEETSSPEVVYKLIEARTAITDESNEEELEGFYDDVIELGTGHEEYKKLLKKAYLMSGYYGKTAGIVEHYMVDSFMPELDYNKVSISKMLLTRIAIAVATREEAVSKELRAYVRAHK